MRVNPYFSQRLEGNWARFCVRFVLRYLRTLSIDKAKVPEDEDGVTDCSSFPSICEKCGLGFIELKREKG